MPTPLLQQALRDMSPLSDASVVEGSLLNPVHVQEHLTTSDNNPADAFQAVRRVDRGPHKVVCEPFVDHREAVWRVIGHLSFKEMFATRYHCISKLPSVK